MNKRHGKPVDYRSYRYSRGDPEYLASLVRKSARIRAAIAPTPDSRVSVSCPCGGWSEAIGNGYMRCECGHIHAEAVRSAQAVASVYEGDEEYNAHYVGLDQAQYKRATIYAPKAAYVRSFVDQIGQISLADVGAGVGLFIDQCEWASVCHAIELNPIWRQYIEDMNRGERAVATCAAIPSKPEAFDVITAWAVIEHTVNPESLVRDMVRALKPGGTLVIEVPRAASVSTALFLADPAAAWRHMTADHLHLFSDRSLLSILEREGMRVEEIWYYGLDALTVAVANNLPITNCAATQETIDADEESDAMVVVSRRAR